MSDLVATYGSHTLPVTGRNEEGQLLVWHEGHEHLAHDLVIDGHRVDSVDLAPVVVPANPGIVADLVATNSAGGEIVWSPPVVAWRVDRVGGYGEAWIARDNTDGIGPVSDVPAYYTFTGFRTTDLSPFTGQSDGAS